MGRANGVSCLPETLVGDDKQQHFTEDVHWSHKGAAIFENLLKGHEDPLARNPTLGQSC